MLQVDTATLCWRAPRFCGVLLTFMVSLLALTAVTAHAENAPRDWTVEDSIGVRYYVADPADSMPGFIGPPQAADEPARASPDGKHFLVMSFRGDLAADAVEYQLDVYSVDDVRRMLRRAQVVGTAERVAPRRRLVLSTQHSRPDLGAILQPQWENNESIVFMGTVGKKHRHLYRYRIDTAQLSALTPEDRDVVSGGMPVESVQGESVVFATLTTLPWRPLDEYPMAVVKGRELSQLEDASRSRVQLHASCKAGMSAEVAMLTEGTRWHGPWLSPNGRHAVVVFVPEDIAQPEAWKDYERPWYGYRYMLIDVCQGTVMPMIDAPVGLFTEAGKKLAIPFLAQWSKDGTRVVLTNTALPLDRDRAERRRMSYVVEYSIQDGKWTVVRPVLRPDGSKFPEPTTHPGAGHPVPGIQIRIAQSANEPPRLVAAQGRREVTLSEPDPALSGIWRARSEIFEWKEDGKEVKGLLMLPRAYRPGMRVPLVIQGFSYEPHAFRPDGVASGAFAGQALAAQGFAVAQIEFAYHEDPAKFMTPAEGPSRVARIDALVKQLDGQGIIDPERVGVIGFSRSGYATYYTLTHPGRVRLAAAIVFDSISASYGEYVNQAGMGGMGMAVYGRQYGGGGTFWENKQSWVEGAPAFNVEKITTPVLFAVTGGGLTGNGAWSALETVGAFRYNRRPFEYLVFGQGVHSLQRPRERVAAMQAAVDWMNFWLQSKEPAPEQGDRASRWRTMRTEWMRERAQKAH